MYRYLLILLLLCALPPGEAWAAARHAPAFGLNRLALGIATAPAPLRADLARIALDELAAVYADEAAQARRDMRRRKGQRKLAGWTVGVEALALDYATLAESVRPDTPVQISIGPEHSLYLVVNGRLVGVSSPRMHAQADFEQRVIARFCALNRCEDWVEEPVTPVKATTRRSNVVTQWSFSQSAGPVCSSGDGLEFQFLNTGNLARKRVVCALFVDELNTLAAAIKQKMNRGVRVNWKRLAIHPHPDGDERVVLNSEGDSLQLALPTLLERPKLFADLRPWLAAKVKDTPYSLVVIHAGQRLALPGRSLD